MRAFPTVVRVARPPGLLDRMHGEVLRPGPASDLCVDLPQPEVELAGDLRIPEGVNPRPVADQEVAAVLEAAVEVQRADQAHHQGEHARLTSLGREPLGVGQGLLESLGGLGMGIAADGLVGGPAQVLDRCGAPLGPRVVVGEAIDHLVEPVRVLALEHLPDRLVQGAAPAQQEAVVGDLVGERVNEDISRLLGVDPLVDELQALQLPQVGLERRPLLPQRLEQRERELAADHRRRPQEPARLLGQEVDAGRQHVADGPRDAGRCPLVVPVAERPRQLLREEGVALGPLDGHLGEPPGELVAAQGPADHVGALRGAEGLQRQLPRVGEAQPGSPVPGTIGAEEEDRGALEVVREGRQGLVGEGVHPMQVLVHEHERTAAAPIERHLDEGLGGARPHGLGSEAGERLVLLLGPEQVQEKGLALVGIEADLVEREAELLPHRAARVALGDPAGRADVIPHRQVRGRTSVGQAAPLDQRDPLARSESGAAR